VDLKDIRLLEGVGQAERRELLASSTERTLEEGEVLIEQGARRETMYILLEGELGVHLDDLDHDPVAVLGAGESVGELSILDGSSASAFVVARSDCKLLAISEDDFWHLTQSSHGFAINLLVKLAERLRANNATVSDNVQKRRLYERAAMFDGLTGIHNRRWLDETLHRLHRRHEKSGDPICLSLLDIDHFKSFNDTHGHDAGDHVLTQVATTLRANLRPTDLCARFGGEEFVIVFPDLELDDAVAAAERVRVAIAELELAMPDGTALPRVTISLGVAELGDNQAVPDFLKAADKAMYEAKEGGRNRVVRAPS
jgi:diguanylate cyclase (GGDEF)-like protein